MLNKRALALAIKAGIVQASDKQMIVDANWENLEKFTNLIAEECAQISDTISKTTLKKQKILKFKKDYLYLIFDLLLNI